MKLLTISSITLPLNLETQILVGSVLLLLRKIYWRHGTDFCGKGGGRKGEKEKRTGVTRLLPYPKRWADTRTTPERIDIIESNMKISRTTTGPKLNWELRTETYRAWIEWLLNHEPSDDDVTERRDGTPRAPTDEQRTALLPPGIGKRMMTTNSQQHW